MPNFDINQLAHFNKKNLLGKVKCKVPYFRTITESEPNLNILSNSVQVRKKRNTFLFGWIFKRPK